jgi:ribonuclease III
MVEDDIVAPFSERLEELEKMLGIHMSRPLLFLQALTHDSYFRESNPPWGSNERLEFLGDSVLGLIISHELFNRFPEHSEGTLAQMKANLVSTEFLAHQAMIMNFGRFILLGRGEEMTGGRERPSVLTDTYEALLGALYLDQGSEAVQSFIVPWFSAYFEEDLTVKKNSKSLLQEHIQKYFKSLPLYSVIKEEGPPHQKIFFVHVYFRGELLGSGSGCSKKEAEKEAAGMALNNIEEHLKWEVISHNDGEDEACEES